MAGVDPGLFTPVEVSPVAPSIVACGCLLTYDWLLTIDSELTLVWSGNWNLGKSLYVLNRYLPFIDTFVSTSLLLGEHSPSTCKILFSLVAALITIGIFISESILMIRTYAIWGRSRKIMYAMIALCVVVFVPGVTVAALEILSLEYSPTAPGQPRSCNLTNASPIIFIAYILIAFSETVIVILTIARGLRHLRGPRQPWVARMYQDGVMYYIYILLITVANVIVPVAGPSSLENWLSTPQRVVHSVFCTRVILHIREGTSTPFSPQQRATTTMSTTLDFLSSGECAPMFTSVGTNHNDIELQSREWGGGRASPSHPPDHDHDAPPPAPSGRAAVAAQLTNSN